MRLIAPLAQGPREWRIASGRPGHGSLVFPDPAGDPWDEETWRRWRRGPFREAATAAKLPVGVRPYDLRGSYASLLIKSGMNVVEVSKQLGHSPTMTLSSYARAFEGLVGKPPIDLVAEVRKARGSSHRAAG